MCSDLREENHKNVAKARRHGDAAAVLACLLAGTDTPFNLMMRLSEASDRMAIPSDILDEIKIALKRGYAAEIEHIFLPLPRM